MEVSRLLELLAQLRVPDLLVQAIGLIDEVKANAALAEGVLTDADWAQLEAIHSKALATADLLDAELAVAERR